MTSVYYQTYKHFIKINNYRESLFMILPKGSFDIHDEFLMKQDSYAGLDNDTQNQKNLMLSRLKSEKEQYESLIEQKLDEEVLFGQEVVLQHYDSQAYLSASYTCSEFSSNSFLVALSKHLSSQCLFLILPYNTYQKINQSIYYDEPFCLFYERQKSYLDVVEQQNCILDSQFEYMTQNNEDNLLLPLQQLQAEIKMPQVDCKRYDIVIANNPDSSWRFKIHQTNQQRKEKIKLKNYSLITLQYTKNRSYLSVDQSSDEVILKMQLEKNFVTLDSIWELQSVQNAKQKVLEEGEPTRKGKKSILQQIQQQDNTPMYDENKNWYSLPQDLGYSQVKMPSSETNNFILRHYITGKVLTVEELDEFLDEENQMRKAYIEPISLSENQIIHIDLAKQGETNLQQNAYIFIEFQQKVLQICSKIEAVHKDSSVEQSTTNNSSVKSKKLDSNSFVKFIQLYIQFQEVNFINKNFVHAFQINKISINEKNHILFVLSAQEVLFLFVKILHQSRERIKKMFNIKFLNEFILIQKRLIAYINNEASDVSDQDPTEEKPINVRQGYFKQLILVDLLLQSLVLSMKNNLLSEEWQKFENQKIRLIFLQTYQIITILLNNNQQIKMHISQWLELFLHQAMLIDEPIVQNCLYALLNDNIQAISTYLKEDAIIRVVEILFEQKPHEKYLSILSAICVCNDIPIPANQSYVIQHFFEKNKFGFSYTFEKQKNNKVLVKYQNEPFNEFENLYFQAYINLLSDVCTGRNPVGLEYVSRALPLDMLCTLIEDNHKIQPFLKLVHNAYVNDAIYPPIRRIDKIKEWDRLNSNILRTSVPYELLPENTHLSRVMDFVKKQIEIPIIKYDETILCVLNIIKSTLELGFWKSIENDLKHIAQNVLLRVCGREDVDEMAVSCKILGCQIIELIIEYESSVRLNKLTEEFKKVMEQGYEKEEIRAPDKSRFERWKERTSRRFSELKDLLFPYKRNYEVEIVAEGIRRLKKATKTGLQVQVDSWLKIFNKIMKESELFKSLPTENTVETILMKMTLQRNAKIMEYSLKLLRQLYGQRKTIFETFRKLIFLDEKQIKTRELANQVRQFEEISDLDINFLDNLNQWCILLKTHHQDDDEENEQQEVFNEYETNERLHQHVLRAYKIDENIIKIIRKEELETRELNICYRFLTLLIWNNLQSKIEIEFELKLAYKHMNYVDNSVDFVREIFHNNKVLLYNEKEVKKLVKCVQSIIKRTPKDTFHRAKLLDLIRVLQYDSNKPIKANQLLTLQILQRRKYALNMIFLNPLKDINWDEYQFKLQIAAFRQNYSSDNILIKMDPQLMYLTVFFEVFALLVEDRNFINADKCRAIHPQKILIQILNESIDCWPLQHFARSYLNRLYYRINNDERISQIFIQNDLSIIVKQLANIINYRKSQMFLKNIKIANSVRFTYLFTYVYCTLEEILFTLNEILVNDNFLVEIEVQLENTNIHCIQLLRLMDLLKEIKGLWFKSNYIMKFIDDLLALLEVITQGFLQQDIIPAEQPISIEQSPLIQLSQEESLAMLQKVLKKMFRLRSIKKLLNMMQQDQEKRELNINLSKICNQLGDNIKFKNYLEEEFNSFCDFQEIKQQNELSLRKFITNIIEMNIAQPDCLNDELKIFFIKVLVRLISRTNNNKEAEGLPIDKWTPEQMSNECKKDIEKEQNFLEEIGAASLIYQMFMDPTLQEKWELCNQLIVFTNAFLLNGNTKCQNSLLSKFKQDSNNQMLTNFRLLISKLSRYVLTNMKIRIKEDTQKGEQFNKSFIICDYLDNCNQFSLQSQALRRILSQAYQSSETTKQNEMSISIICSAFRMLQLLCENNNFEMKNYLRDQRDKDDNVKLASINFVEFSTKQLRRFLKILNEKVAPIASQIIDFINEVIQLPALENQQTLCKSTYFQDACHTSLYQNKVNLPPEEIANLEGKVLSSVLLVLEGNKDTNYEDLQAKLDPKFLIKFIKNSNVDVKQLRSTSFRTFPPEVQRIFDVFIIKEKIANKYPDSKWVNDINFILLTDKDIQTDIQKYILEKLKRIEIFYEEDNSNQLIFFPSHPVFNFLSEETKDKIMFEAPRETQREKLVFLIQKLSDIQSEIEYNYALNRFIIPITHKTMNIFTNLAQFLSMAVSIYMMVSYEVQIKNGESTYIVEDYEDFCLQLLSYSQLTITIIFFIFYIISNLLLELKRLQESNEKKGNSIIEFFKKQWRNMITIVTNEDFIQNLIFVLFSFLGTFSNHYYFSLHLFYIFSRFSMLTSVFQAISHNASQLLMVAMLGVMFQFVFSNVAFYNYVDDIYPDENPEETCTSLISCMITLMTSGVIGQSMKMWDPQKFVYDTVYMVFFGLLFTNIISGIMIDTFAELRDARQKIEDDKKNNCYICGIDRVTLEKNQIKLYDHIKENHYLWDYVFYLYCLKAKDSTEYTGLEYWIMDMVEKEAVTWFPIINSDQSDLDSQIKSLTTKINQVKDWFSKKDDNNQLIKVISQEE